MRVLALVHQQDAGPGVFGDAVHTAGHELELASLAASDPPDAPFVDYGALLVFGGGMHVDQEDRHPWLREEKVLLREALAAGVPALGVCLGSQLIAEVAGARVGRAERPEIGWRDIDVSAEADGDPLLGPLAPRFSALEWHSYLFELPPTAVPLALNEAGLQAYRLDDRVWGIQFHAEVTAETIEAWLADYGEDEREAGVDPDALRAETGRRLADFNELGRGLCARFLDVAASFAPRNSSR